MGTVLEFRTDVNDRDQGDELLEVNRNEGHMCEIIIFPGVRIERHHDEEDLEVVKESLSEQVDEESYH